jgi:dTDP-4-dehydrorhamnose 3,5-epimerase
LEEPVIFSRTPIEGVAVIDLEPREDFRGFFARTFCTEEFAAHGIKVPVVQCNVAYNRRRGTLRGLHYQRPPNEEAKLIRCTRGAIFDVVVDLRPDSPTFKRWVASELRADNGRMMWAPEGFAHGFQTLVDDTEVFYQMSVPYAAQDAAGVRWDDPDLVIGWPNVSDRIISSRDRALPLLADQPK